MNVEQLLLEVFENLGEPSDLQILTGGAVNIGLPGTQRLLRWLNDANSHVAYFKVPNGRQIRHRDLYGRQNLTTYCRDVTANPDSQTVFNLSFFTETELPIVQGSVGMALRNDVEAREIVAATVALNGASTTLQVTLDAPFTTAVVVGTPITLHLMAREYRMAPYRVLEISKVFDLYQGLQLELADQDYENFFDTRRQYGNPSRWSKRNSSLFLDSFPYPDRVIQLECWKLPALFTALDQEPEIPELWHHAIVLYAVWKGLVRMEEMSDAQVYMNLFFKEMQMIREQIDLGSETQDRAFYPEVR